MLTLLRLLLMRSADFLKRRDVDAVKAAVDEEIS